ncbi:four helix bundle protein [Flavivirga aquatica]|nr:four helix bundle protein [Flavivirga aquatica]
MKTDYWLDLLDETKFIDEDEFKVFKPKSIEMLRLLVNIVKSSKH